MCCRCVFQRAFVDSFDDYTELFLVVVLFTIRVSWAEKNHYYPQRIRRNLRHSARANESFLEYIEEKVVFCLWWPHRSRVRKSCACISRDAWARALRSQGRPTKNKIYPCTNQATGKFSLFYSSTGISFRCEATSYLPLYFEIARRARVESNRLHLN